MNRRITTGLHTLYSTAQEDPCYFGHMVVYDVFSKENQRHQFYFKLPEFFLSSSMIIVFKQVTISMPNYNTHINIKGGFLVHKWIFHF